MRLLQFTEHQIEYFLSIFDRGHGWRSQELLFIIIFIISQLAKIPANSRDIFLKLISQIHFQFLNSFSNLSLKFVSQNHISNSFLIFILKFIPQFQFNISNPISFFKFLFIFQFFFEIHTISFFNTFFNSHIPFSIVFPRSWNRFICSC